MLDVSSVYSPSSLVISTLSPSLNVTLDTATYNCPCEKTVLVDIHQRVPVIYQNMLRPHIYDNIVEKLENINSLWINNKINLIMMLTK
jgi:hypothetical protein